MITGGPPPDCPAVAPIACSRRSARAVSSSARVGKRRTSIFGMVAPLARARDGRLFDDPNFHIELAGAPLIVKGERRTGLTDRNAGAGVLGGSHGLAVDGEQQVARPQAGLLSWTAHIGDDDAAVGEAELLRLRVGDVLRYDPDPPADDTSILDDVVQHAPDHVYGDRKTDAFDAQTLRDDGGVDADQGAAGINQRAAGVAEIDRCIRLDEVLERRDPELSAGGGADDAVRHGLRQAERITDGEHHVADPQLIGLPEGDDGEVRHVDLEHCQIGIRVHADDLRIRDPAVRELHADGTGVRNHVIVRHDVADLIDDDARAQAALDALLVLRQYVAEELAERRRIDALHDQAGGVYVDYGGGCALHRGRVCHAYRPARSGRARSRGRHRRGLRLRAG